MAQDRSLSLNDEKSPTFSVGRWLVDPNTDTLTLDGKIVKLQPRTMRLLTTLAGRPGDVFASEDLLDSVWPGVVVTGQSLYQAIGELRVALKADAATGDFIANVPRRGYRLMAPVSATSGQALYATAASPPALPRTIAVLPFRDLGLGAERSFLRETLLADLILELSRQPNLSPIARGTMQSYADKAVSPRQVARELGVRYVLDGSISQVERELRIACELVDASTDTVLASESIRVQAAKWPEAAQHVVGRLARSTRLELSWHAARAVDTAALADVSALELAMRAWVELYCRPQGSSTNDRAWQWADEALRLDDSIGAAWNALALCEWRAAQYGWKPRSGRSGGSRELDETALLADAVAHAQRATSLAPSDPDGYYTLALGAHVNDEAASAEANLRHCLEISASYAPAHALLGLVRAVRGHPEETAELCARAFELSPREPLRAIWHWTEACAASMLGRDDEALERALTGIAANPDFPTCYLVAAVVSQRRGRVVEAARYVAALRASAFSSIERLRRVMPTMRVEPWASLFLADLSAAGLPTS